VAAQHGRPPDGCVGAMPGEDPRASGESEGGQGPGGRCLYVLGIPRDSDERDLDRLFGVHGQVEAVSIPCEPITRENRGFAFITMSAADEAEAAIQALNQSEHNGRTLHVELSKRANPHDKTPGVYMGPQKRDHGMHGRQDDRGRYDDRHDDRHDYRREDDRRYEDRRPAFEDRRIAYDDRRPAYDDRRRDDRRYDERRGPYDDRRGGYDDRRYGYDDRRRYEGGYDDRRGCDPRRGYDDRMLEDRRRYDDRRDYGRYDDRGCDASGRRAPYGYDDRRAGYDDRRRDPYSPVYDRRGGGKAERGNFGGRPADAPRYEMSDDMRRGMRGGPCGGRPDQRFGGGNGAMRDRSRSPYARGGVSRGPW